MAGPGEGGGPAGKKEKCAGEKKVLPIPGEFV
jgi:hypothetical protein